VKQGNIRVRIVEYSPGYYADHWCEKGHVIYVLDGEFTSELQDGRKFILSKGMSYIVADNTAPHRSYTEKGVKLFIVD
ncbi:MAG TPA: DHCW motif cupin fold protein, partial [Ignavibacteriaceae bacterium]|nr:DHCW motif cupin fold protein [Ignavibacteriaceae bacterium]